MSSPRTESGAVERELFSARFEAIAREMGEMLRRTALSTNVKERLDFSCALLDADGRLVVNAPHIPVHLGALGLCVRKVRAALDLHPGDVVVTNSPAYGGSHLPDVTVISPIFESESDRRADTASHLLGYVASRAHHAEIGGSRPGSMPPDATRLVEEGVLLPPTLLISRGRPRWTQIEAALRCAPFPSRAVEDNLADLAAAVAANRRGTDGLLALVAGFGRTPVAEQMSDLAERAARRVEGAFRRIGDGVLGFKQRLDDGSPIEVRIEVADGRARIDFSGSAEVHRGNLNATPAIVRSAVLYVLRLLVDEPLPLNEGLLRPVELVVPEGMLNPPFPDDPEQAPAVVGGNTETSQRIVDTLLGAFGLAACSQGTMNNVIFGDPSFGYYETLGGGCGATDKGPGESAIHSHMTNTRITDPEVLERRYPVRLHRFAIRSGSGGLGHRSGGDGLIREIEFLRPVEVSMVTQHRVERPYGVAGGRPGKAGRQWLETTTGERVVLASVAGVSAKAGDRLVVETPGGGGWGVPSPDSIDEAADDSGEGDP